MFRRLKNTLLFTALLLLLNSNCFAGSVDESEEASSFASFIIELIKTAQTAKLGAICLFGNDEISQAIAAREKNVSQFERLPHSISGCKAIYVAKSMERGLRSEIGKLHNSKVMNIAVFEGFIEMGGMIQVQMGRRNFELIVNSKEIKASGARLSALVTSLIIN